MHSQWVQAGKFRYAPSYSTLYDWIIMENGFVLMSEGALFSDRDIQYIPLLHEKEIDFCIYWHKNTPKPAVEQFLERLSRQEDDL